MAETIKKGDFIELEYTGYTTDDNKVFDTTNKEVAEKEGLPLNQEFKPTIVCLGEGHLIKGLDEFLEGKEIGKEYEVTIPPEKAFGKRNAKLLQLIPITKFREQKINPYPGLELNIDGQIGVVRSVNGGRVIIDFNHPLAGKELKYVLKVNKIIKEPEKEVEAILKLSYVPYEKVEYKKDEGVVIIHLPTFLPEAYAVGLTETIKRLTPVKEVSFQVNSPKQ